MDRASSDPFAQALAAASSDEAAVSGAAAQVAPRSVAEVARLVSMANRAGGRLAVSRRPRPGVVQVDLAAMERIEAPDERGGLIRVEAGTTVEAVEARALKAGLTLGTLLPSVMHKRVGAWLAGPTRGERVVAPGRLESAAMALEAVLADGGVYRSREVPARSTGPDLDHLFLGAEGRFGIITGVTLRLLPRAVAEAAASRTAVGVIELVEAARQAVASGLSPAEMRWDRARGTVDARFMGSGAAARARHFGEASIGGRELHAHLEVAGDWSAWAAASPLRPDAVLFAALHSGGAFGALEFADVADAERAARHADHIGFTIVSPRRLRRPVQESWPGGRAGLLSTLAENIDPRGVFAST